MVTTLPIVRLFDFYFFCDAICQQEKGPLLTESRHGAIILSGLRHTLVNKSILLSRLPGQGEKCMAS